MNFSQAQQKAITHKDGPCLVLAGPGSGKTLTIVNRIEYLIQTCKVRPEEILVITFTKYAAEEMKHRFHALDGGERLPVTFGTFHGIYYGILKWAYGFGSENILSEEEKFQLLRHAVSHQEIEVADEKEFMQDIAAEIGIVKNNGHPIETYESVKCEVENFRNIFMEYEKQRKKVRKIDFDDMLVLCKNLFLSRPDILAKWQERFRYILVDEFQDINQVQYDVIRMLAAPQDNLFAVGDDDQSIYGFRGAKAELLFQFRIDYPSGKELLLNINYRSTSNIVDNARKVIERNETRFSKEIKAHRGIGELLHVQETKDPQDEGAYVAEEIAKQIKSGRTPEQIAVLFRSHHDAGALIEMLIERDISFQMKEHIPNIYTHFIGENIKTYFRLSKGSRSRQDFLNVMNRPKRYLARESLEESEISFESLRRFYCDKVWMQDRVDQLELDLRVMGKMAPYAAIQYLRKRVGYDEFLREYAKSRNMCAEDYFDILHEIEEHAKQHTTLEEWFAHVEKHTAVLKQQEKRQVADRSGVRLMTMHGAKGLEFDTVFIIEANEDTIPYKKAKTVEETEEERRLFYVAMTRAREELIISYVKEQSGKERSPSRFVNELFLSV